MILQLEEHSKGDKEFTITSLYILELANRATELFQSSKVEQKQQLISFVLSNVRLKGEKLLYDLQKPFDALVEMGKSQDWLQLPELFRTTYQSDIIRFRRYIKLCDVVEKEFKRFVADYELARK